MCNKMEWHRETYWTAEMYLILRTKVFVGDDSFKTPPAGETNCMSCSDVILSSNLEASVASSMNSDL